MRIEIPSFSTRTELFKYLRENHDTIMKQKKAFDIHSDVYKVGDYNTINKNIDYVVKSDLGADEIEVKMVLSTTLVMDSHMDVHDNGCWNKSISDSNKRYHLQEHIAKFSGVISEDTTVSTSTMDWRNLGIDKDGQTEALVMVSRINKARNAEMYKQYINGWVNNHSVGMRYVKMLFALDSKEAEDAQWKENYDNYIGRILNAEEAKDRGYFWIVKESKLLEGSAVLFGSNSITPTLQIATPTKFEPPQGTQKNEPDYKNLLNELQKIKL